MEQTDRLPPTPTPNAVGPALLSHQLLIPPDSVGSGGRGRGSVTVPGTEVALLQKALARASKGT